MKEVVIEQSSEKHVQKVDFYLQKKEKEIDFIRILFIRCKLQEVKVFHHLIALKSTEKVNVVSEIEQKKNDCFCSSFLNVFCLFF